MEPKICSDEFFTRFVKEAPYIPGDDGEVLEGKQIEWLNPELVKEGQDFARRNYLSIILAQMLSLLLGFSFKNLASVLLRTGESSDVTSSLKRYMDTAMHLLKWYESDILAQKDEGFKDIQLVRKMHSNALKISLREPLKLFTETAEQSTKEKRINAIKKDLICFSTSQKEQQSWDHILTYYPEVLMSQFDMAITQFGFVGHIFLFPDSIGIKDTKGMEGFLHMWAVIGRLIGIQDRFNLALHSNRELFVKIYETVGMSGIMNTDLSAAVLQESFCIGTAKLLSVPSIDHLLYFGLKSAKKINPEYTGENIYNTMSWNEIFHLRVLEFLMFLIYHCDFIRQVVNKVARKRIDKDFQKLSLMSKRFYKKTK